MASESATTACAMHDESEFTQIEWGDFECSGLLGVLQRLLAHTHWLYLLMSTSSLPPNLSKPPQPDQIRLAPGHWLNMNDTMPGKGSVILSQQVFLNSTFAWAYECYFRVGALVFLGDFDASTSPSLRCSNLDGDMTAQIYFIAVYMIATIVISQCTWLNRLVVTGSGHALWLRIW